MRLKSLPSLSATVHDFIMERHMLMAREAYTRNRVSRDNVLMKKGERIGDVFLVIAFSGDERLIKLTTGHFQNCSIVILLQDAPNAVTT